MNYRFVFRQVGILIIGMGVIMLLLAAVAGYELFREKPGEDRAAEAFLLSAGFGFLLGGGLWYFTRKHRTTLARREAMLLVSASWILGAAVAAAPYFLWAHLSGAEATGHPFRSAVNCYFEATSGLTTTGATILTGIDRLPESLLLWRSTTHWLGGLGIIVMFVAVLPSLGVGGKRLFHLEAPGPSKTGIHPRIRETARVLWLTYLGLTVAEILALKIAGMRWIEAICHAMGTLATGGFSTLDASVGGYRSVAVDVIIIVFMVLAGGNFSLYYHALNGRWKQLWRDTELRVYLGMLALASLLVVISIGTTAVPLTTGDVATGGIGPALRYGIFTTVSVSTTTGFCTADFNQWPFLAKATLVLLMFVGGCSGSTAGGIKVVRVWIALKAIFREFEKVFRPNVVRPRTIGNLNVDPELRMSTLAFVLSMILLFVLGSGAVMLLEPPGTIDYTTAATASVASLCTIGPGLNRVGAIENYAWLTGQSKAVLTFLMMVGRLEIFAILALFVPRFWRAD